MFEHLAKLAEEIGRKEHAEHSDPQEDGSDITGEKIAEAIRAADLQWTTTPPTQEGWYWAQWKDGKREIIEAFHHIGSGDPMAYRGGWDSYDESDFTHWFGPLSVPEPPTKP
jgi:hypothetical protein